MTKLDYRTIYEITRDHTSARILRHLLVLWRIRGSRPYIWSKRSRTTYFTGASAYLQRKAEALLVSLGLLTTFKSGFPPKPCYIIHEEALLVKAQHAAKRRKRRSPPSSAKVQTAVIRARTTERKQLAALAAGDDRAPSFVKILTNDKSLENQCFEEREGSRRTHPTANQAIANQKVDGKSSSDSSIVKILTIEPPRDQAQVIDRSSLRKTALRCGNIKRKKERREEREEKREKRIKPPYGGEFSEFSPVGGQLGEKSAAGEGEREKRESCHDFTGMADFEGFSGNDGVNSSSVAGFSANDGADFRGPVCGDSGDDDDAGNDKSKSLSLSDRIVVTLPKPKFAGSVVREFDDPIREIEVRNAGRLVADSREAVWYDPEPRGRPRVRFLDASHWARQFYKPEAWQSACRELSPYVPDPEPFRMITHFKDRQGDVWMIDPYNREVLHIERVIRRVEEYVRHLDDLALVREHLIHFDRDTLEQLLAATSMLEVFEIVWRKHRQSALPYRRLYLGAHRKGVNTAKAVRSLLEQYSPLFIAAVFDTYITLSQHVTPMEWELRYLESEQYPIIYFCNRFERFAAIHERRVKELVPSRPTAMTPLDDFILAVRAAVVSLRRQLSQTRWIRDVEGEG